MQTNSTTTQSQTQNQNERSTEKRIDQAQQQITELLQPSGLVATICGQLGFKFRHRIYTPMVTVWMFISQVISADHSCQQSVSRLNVWRVARGLSRVSSETTSYCKARAR